MPNQAQPICTLTLFKGVKLGRPLDACHKSKNVHDLLIAETWKVTRNMCSTPSLSCMKQTL